MAPRGGRWARGGRVRSSRRGDPVRDNAVRTARAAGLGPPRPPPAIARGGFPRWVLGRLFGLVVLAGAAYLVYSAATSDQFQLRRVRVVGNVLLSQAEVEEALGLRGLNLFWVDRQEAAARVATLAPVRSAWVTPVLPDTLDVRVVERQPVAFWRSGDSTYLVDREGVILTAIDPEAPPPRACGGQVCDPHQATTLLTVTEPDGPRLAPGDRVDAGALAAAARLATLLPSSGIRPLGFEWSAATGVEVPTADGWRARFDSSDGDGTLASEIATLQSVRAQLGQAGVTPQLIDVRFEDRPYWR
jgi:POTRA domain, FtsQ-type